MAKVIVQVSGGLVQDVFKTEDGNINGVVIMDFDTEGEDGDNLTITQDDQGSEINACIYEMPFSELPADCDVLRLYNKWKEETLKQKEPNHG
jgi:hypothetical protein